MRTWHVGLYLNYSGYKPRLRSLPALDLDLRELPNLSPVSLCFGVTHPSVH